MERLDEPCRQLHVTLLLAGRRLHLYLNHVDQVRLQLTRTSCVLPHQASTLNHPTSRDPYGDQAAAFLCLEETLKILGKYQVIQLFNHHSLRLTYYTPYPVREEFKQVRPGVYRLNWPDFRRGHSSHTLRAFMSERFQREAAKTGQRFRAVVLSNASFSYETDSLTAAFRWMQSQWRTSSQSLP